MRVLIACEFSGVVRDAFIERGHDAWSCDLPEVTPEGEWTNRHKFGDALSFIRQRWDLMIAHPPCTFLCNSGVRWLYDAEGMRDPKRWRELRDAAHFFNALLSAPIKRIAIENPIMHGHAKRLVKRGPDQMIQPYQYGHGEVKRSYLWLKNLPPLTPTRVVRGRHTNTHWENEPERSKKRSRTKVGIARAMAKQWGDL